VGIDWSPHPTEADARREYERIWALLGDRTIEDLVDLPLIQDPEARATLDVLTSLVLPALYTDKNLYALSVCMAVNLSLVHGNSEASPLNYVATAMIAGPRFGHYDEGYRFGRVACDLLERRGLTHFGARTYVGFAIVVPWTRPLREGIEPSRRAFQMAKEHGDPTYAALASRGLSNILLATGHPLDRFEPEAQDALEFVQAYGFFLDRLSAPIALARTLRGRTRVARTLIEWLSLDSRLPGISFRPTEVNGGPGILVFDSQQRLIGVTALDIADGEIKAIGSIANPDKLRHLGPVGNLGWVLRRDR